MDHKPTAIAEELAGRLEFIGLDAAALDSIRLIEPIVARHLPVALERFYRKLAVVPAVSRFFDGTPQMDRARGSQNTHWSALARGEMDDAYLASSRRVGPAPRYDWARAALVCWRVRPHRRNDRARRHR